MYCNRNPDVHYTMSIIPKIDDYHKANFVITVVTAGYHRDHNLQRSW